MSLSFTDPMTPLPRERGLFCNRTLNMRAIRAIGYDMDYTLVHYDIAAWESRAYEHLKQRLVAVGLPVGHLVFEPEGIIRGLVIDRELGNVVKANRFGYVKRAFHGTRPLGFEELRAAYSRTMIDLSESRWVFLNTLFSLSEAYMFSQLVDLFDAGELKAVQSYPEIYELTRRHIDLTHMEGQLKAEIMAKPERFVQLDADTPLALLDQQSAGKQLMLITNSEWPFTVSMMSYTFDRFMPKGKTWRDLFDIVIVAANKPSFFSTRFPFLEVASEEGLLRPVIGPLVKGKAYYGGSATVVEQFLGLSGDEILYVGDHIFGDVHVTKNILRWRTALIVRELEHEIRASLEAQEKLDLLAELMSDKEVLERDHCTRRLLLTRLRAGYGPTPPEEIDTEEELTTVINALRARITELDERIAPLARAASEVSNGSWGPTMWAGNDKSHFARQVERYADVYTSRVSNFAFATPFVYLRSQRGTMPHDVAPAPAAGKGAYATGAPSTRSELLASESDVAPSGSR
ncbi:MAG: HAD-IG family 5'-nucleotidase [Polyangiaceae bacterium]|nr:HAD-IG family 5'-nucleotidase [Polyangiaceae bacterium]